MMDESLNGRVPISDRNMSSDDFSLNNKEIVRRALDLIMKGMQDTIRLVMESTYGPDWWATKIYPECVELGVCGRVPKSGDDFEKFRGHMDIQLCCKIIKFYEDDLFPKNYSGFDKLLHSVLRIRNDTFHTGNMTCTDEVANAALEKLIDFDYAMDLDLYGELKKFKELIGRAPSESVDESGGLDIDVNSDAEPEHVFSTPEKSLIDYRSVTVKSCRGYHNALTELQQSDDKKYNRTGTSEIGVSFNKRGEVYKLTLLERGQFTVDDSTELIVDGMKYGIGDVCFDNFDKSRGKVDMYPGLELKELLDQASKNKHVPEIKLVNDMKWLVKRTEEYFNQFADEITYPYKYKLYKDYSLSRNYDGLSDAQTSAVKMIMKDPLAYVWGVPGSGKTRYVLATAINECVHRGEKVAVIAPTNQALEQVLRGLIDAFETDDESDIDTKQDILRVGTPTSEFIELYPYVCETNDVLSKLNGKKHYLKKLEIALADKKYELLAKRVDDVRKLIKSHDGGSDDTDGLTEAMKPFLDVMKDDPRNSSILEMHGGNVLRYADRILTIIYNPDRQRVYDGSIVTLSMEELESEIKKTRHEILELSSQNPKSVETCKVVAMTLSKYLMSFGPVECDRRKKLDVDRVFVDEAGYCNCIQVLSLFALGVPVTLLGDHKQLPPVCEIDDNALREHIRTEDGEYNFLWDLPSLYVDGFFDETMSGLEESYITKRDPEFRYTSKTTLNTTHRFGQNLANALGKIVYKTDITSQSENPLEIEIVDAHIDEFPIEYCKKRRKNRTEALEIGAFVTDNNLGNEDYVILTPYTDQIKCIKNEHSNLKDKIMTIHRSQGREWDTVIISVCDGRACDDKDKPPRFTSTAKPGSIGEKVLNTALSRAKKKLVIVCDRDYWSPKQNELLGELCRMQD